MKLFKRIYYPIMAALVAFMLIMGFVDASVGGMGKKLDAGFIDNVSARVEEISDTTHNSYAPSSQDGVRKYIIDSLTKEAIMRDFTNTPNNDKNDMASYRVSNGKIQPTLYLQNTTMRKDTMDKMENANANANVMVDKTINNIIVAVPGSLSLEKKKSDAILLTAHYDSSYIGGASDAVAVGAMIENAISASKSATPFKNDIVFLFTDASKDGACGAYTFMNQFAGFDNIVSRIKLSANFDTSGNSGTLMMYASSKDNMKLIGQYSKINDGTFASSAVNTIYSLVKGVSDFDAFKGNALNFTNVGGKLEYGTANDTFENISRSFIQQQADAMNKFYNHFGGLELTKLDSESSAVFFSYLDIMTIWYPVAVAFVMAGIIVGLVIAIILLNRKKNAFSWKKAGAGAFVQLLTILATALTLFVGYYLLNLLLSGLGIITLHSISSLVFTNPGLMISVMLFTFAISSIFYIILKRTFAVKASDVVRGNSLIWALAAAIICFAAPSISYLFAIVAILSLTVLLLTTILKDKFKAKFNMDIERLFLYVWVIVLALPLFIPVFMMSGTILPAITMPIIMSVFVGLLGFIAPYVDYLKVALDKVAKKFPARTVRYERMVTERVEDPAKKGKFSDETKKKIVKEKIAWNYLNRMGISVVAVISTILIVVFASVGTSTYSTTVAGAPTYQNAIYDDSMLYVWESNDSGATSTVEVYDQMAYKFINYAIPDLKWNSSKSAYVKDYTGKDLVTVVPTIESNKDTGLVEFKSFDYDYSVITITLNNASAVSSVTFNKGDDNREEEYTFVNQQKIEFTLPYGYKDFNMTIVGTCEMEYVQHIYNAENIKGVGDWDKLREYYNGENGNKVYNSLKMGMILKLKKTI